MNKMDSFTVVRLYDQALQHYVSSHPQEQLVDASILLSTISALLSDTCKKTDSQKVLLISDKGCMAVVDSMNSTIPDRLINKRVMKSNSRSNIKDIIKVLMILLGVRVTGDQVSFRDYQSLYQFLVAFPFENEDLVNVSLCADFYKSVRKQFVHGPSFISGTEALDEWKGIRDQIMNAFYSGKNVSKLVDVYSTIQNDIKSITELIQGVLVDKKGIEQKIEEYEVRFMDTITRYEKHGSLLADLQEQFRLACEPMEDKVVVATVVEPVVEPAVEPVIELVAELISESAVTPVAEPVVEAVVEPIVEAVVEAVIEPVVEAVVEVVIEPVAEAVVEPVVEAVIEPVVEAVIEPVVEAVIEPVVEAVVEPVVEAVVEPVTEAAIEPIAEVVVEPVVEEEVEPPMIIDPSASNETAEDHDHDGEIQITKQGNYYLIRGTKVVVDIATCNAIGFLDAQDAFHSENSDYVKSVCLEFQIMFQ